MAKKGDSVVCVGLQGRNRDERLETFQSPSRRHREKLNSELEELGKLLPLPEDVRSKLDKLSILRLVVSFFQTENFVGGRKQNVRQEHLPPCNTSDPNSNVLKKFKREGLSLARAALEALGGFFIIFTGDGDVFYVSENVKMFTGYAQTFLMHQNFEQFIDPDDTVGFRECLARPPEVKIVELDRNGNPQSEGRYRRTCFCSIRCHAGRQSSHVSPFFYKSFKFDGYQRLVNVKSGTVKEYCYFAIVVPTNGSTSPGRTPRDIVPYYQIKVGLDYKIYKLDNNGKKHLQYSDKQLERIDAYLLFHPEDIPGMAQMHKHLIASGKCNAVFRALTGKGIWRWVRGSARIVYDKKGEPEFVIASNWLVSDEEGVYYKKQLLGSGDEDQPAITDGNEDSKKEDVNKQQNSKASKSKDQNSKPVVKKSSQRKSNKRKQRETESDELTISNGMANAVTERLPSLSDTGYETTSNSSSSPLPLASRQPPLASMSSASPDSSVTGRSPASISSSGPGSCEIVPSPKNDSSNDGIWMDERVASLHHQNRNFCPHDAVSPGQNIASSSNMVQAVVEQSRARQQCQPDASNVQNAIYENEFPVTTGQVAMSLTFASNVPDTMPLPNMPQAAPLTRYSLPMSQTSQDRKPDMWASHSMPQAASIRPSTLSHAPQDMNSSQTMSQSVQGMSPYTRPSLPLPQAVQVSRPSLPMSQAAQGMRPSPIMPQTIQGMPQTIQGMPQTIQSMPQASQNLRTSVPMSQAAQGMIPSQTMAQTVQGMRPNIGHSSFAPQAAQQAMMSHANSVGPTVPQAAQDMRPALATPQALQNPTQNVDPGAILQQEVNLSDDQLQALKKFLTNLDTNVGQQQATLRLPGQRQATSLESQLGSFTADKLELLRSLLNGQDTRTVYSGEQAPGTAGNVSNGMMGQQLPQQADIPNSIPMTAPLVMGTKHSAVPAYSDSFESPLNYVVRNTQELRIDSNTFIGTPYSDQQQSIGNACAYNQQYQVPLNTANSNPMVQQRVDHYPPVSATGGTNHTLSQNFAKNLLFNVSNHADFKLVGGQSSCLTNGPSLGVLQMQENAHQAIAQLPVDNCTPGFRNQPVVTTSNSCEYTFVNGAASLTSSSGFNTHPDMIDLQITKDLYVAPQSMQNAMLMQQQHQTPNTKADACLPVLHNSTPADQFMSPVGQMQAQSVVPETLFDDIGIPSLPVLEEILASQDSDNLLSEGQVNNPQEFHLGQYAQRTAPVPAAGVYSQYNGHSANANIVNSAAVASQIGNSYNECQRTQ